MERLGKYELHQKLGEGGFGRVWKAFDPDLQVWRALKEPFDQSAELEQELKEARIQARLDHPGTVRIVGAERIEGRFFLVMEYVDGKTLREILREKGKLPPQEADAILASLFKTLAHAHAKGVAHLDLKPGNIFVQDDGTVKIGDFGLSRTFERTMVTTSTVRGTLHYMSPEQLDGKIGPSVDLWAMGAIAYELYTGMTAVQGKTQGEIIKNVSSGAIRNLSQVPPDRKDLVSSLLKPNPAERCPSAAEALKHFQTETLTAEEWAATQTAQIAKAKSRLPGIIKKTLPLAFLLALAALGYGIWYGFIDAPIVENALQFIEKAPKGERPSAEFYSLPPEEKLNQAWTFADDGNYAKAHKAAEVILKGDAPDEIASEALYLKAQMEARNLNAPWHASASLNKYLTEYKDGKFSMQGRLLLAEIYIDLDRSKKGMELLDEAVRIAPDSPLLADALMLADRCEEEMRNGNMPGLKFGKSLLASILPNNMSSLIISFMSVCAFLIPSLLWIAMSFHDPNDPDPASSVHGIASVFKKIWSSKVHRILFLGFLSFQVLQFVLNRLAASNAESQLLEAVKLLKTTVGG